VPPQRPAVKQLRNYVKRRKISAINSVIRKGCCGMFMLLLSASMLSSSALLGTVGISGNSLSLELSMGHCTHMTTHAWVSYMSVAVYA